MFDVDPIVWLQSWASPVLTAVMNGISLLGYTRAHVAIAVLFAFGFRMRAAVALLVLIALNGAFTDIVKTAALTPRPDADGRVQALSQFAADLRQRDADTPTDVEDSSAFPSGHVSATTTFALGLAWLLKCRRRGWLLAWGAIAAMAVSRMYLGRHFAGDVLGGVAAGCVVLGVGFGVLKLAQLAGESQPLRSWPASRVMTIALVFSGSALLVGLPDAGDAGRLIGTAVGVVFLTHYDRLQGADDVRSRAVRVVVAAGAFAAAWAVMTAALSYASPSGASAIRLAASALPNAAVLVAPALVRRRFT